MVLILFECAANLYVGTNKLQIEVQDMRQKLAAVNVASYQRLRQNLCVLS